MPIVVLRYVALGRYEYAMRIDEDAIVHKFGVNPLHAMQRNHAVYGYALEKREEHFETVFTFDTWLRQAYNIDYDRKIYFTNIFISRVDWWRRSVPCFQISLP